jgi:hypothetical protein
LIAKTTFLIDLLLNDFFQSSGLFGDVYVLANPSSVARPTLAKTMSNGLVLGIYLPRDPPLSLGKRFLRIKQLKRHCIYEIAH